MFKATAFALSLLTGVSAYGADEPKWLTDARAREGKILKPTEIRSKDGWFKARVPGKLVGIIEKVEGSYTVELDIGADVNVACEVYPEGINLANALRVTFGNLIKSSEKSQGKVDLRVLEASDAGAHGAVPYLSLTWLYRVAAADGARVGALKQFAMEKGPAGVYCAHNEFGYTKSFAAVTRAFAESLEAVTTGLATYYTEISTFSMAGQEVGVAVATLERDSEGDTRARQMTAMLIATTDGAVQSQDSERIDWLRPDGSLINSSNTDVSNGEVENSLSLQRDEGTWIVDGEVQGKAVKAQLPKDSQPGTWVIQAQQLRALLAEPDAVGREHSIGIWLAANPDKLTVEKTKILARLGDNQFSARGEFGGIGADLKLDKASGTPSGAEIKVGPIDARLERIYVNGSF